MAVYDDYLWLVVVGAIGAFWFGWGTGSNDVANAFGTSVGAKTLTLKQAVLLAACFEFTGALVLGRVSTDTIAGGIANTSIFAREPEIYAYGMMIALFVAALWQTIGSYMGWNVSSTHSIIGGIIGFSLVYKGSDGVNWATYNSKNFPPYAGVVPIILAWFVAPLLGGCASAIIFFVCRTSVLRWPNAYQRSYWVLPPIVTVTAFINIFFVFTKGAKKSLSAEDDWSDEKAAWIAACVAAGCGLITGVVVLPILKYRATAHFDKQEADTAAAANPKVEPDADVEAADDADSAGLPELDDAGRMAAAKKRAKMLIAMAYHRSKKFVMQGMEQDIFDVVEEDPTVKAMHERAEQFDPRAEFVFSYLQVFSAICVVFAHGAGEVGYMAGPLGTIWAVYEEGKLPSKVNPPIWVILIGAIGLVIGLATYGANICRTVGTKMAKLSPTRGFSAELATSFVIMIAAQYGLPVSSSQVITGAIVGVGLLEGAAGVNWKWFATQLLSWVTTMIFMGIFVAAVFAQGLYAPGRASGNQVIAYEDAINSRVSALLKNFNTTLYSSTAGFGFQPTYTPTLVKQVNYTYNNIRTITGLKQQTTRPEDVIKYLDAALNLYQKHAELKSSNIDICPNADSGAGKCVDTPVSKTIKLTSNAVALDAKNI